MTQLEVLRRCLLLAALPLVFITFGLPLRARDIGASAVEIGLLFSLFTFALLVVRPLVGIGLDHYGRRPFFLAALLVYVLANSLYVFSESLNGLYLARLFQGIGAALLLITTDAVTADLSPRESMAEAMGRNMEAQARGGMLGAFIGFTLVGAIPVLAWQGSFIFYALGVLAALAFAWRFLEEPPATAEKETSGFAQIQLTPQLKGLFVLVFISGFANALIQPLYLIYLQERFDASMLLLAWAFLPAGIVHAVLPSRLGRLGDRMGRSTAVATGLFLAGLLYLVLPLLPNLLAVAVAYTLGHIGWALADPARQAWIGAQANPDERGRVFGYSELCGGTGATLGPLIGGYLYDFHGQTVAFMANATILICTTIAIFGLKLLYKKP